MQSPQQHLTPNEQLLQACEVKDWKLAVLIMSVYPDLNPRSLTDLQRHRIEIAVRRWSGEPVNQVSIFERLMGYHEYCAHCGKFTKHYKEVIPDKFWHNPLGTHICRECDDFFVNQKVG